MCTIRLLYMYLLHFSFVRIIRWQRRSEINVGQKKSVHYMVLYTVSYILRSNPMVIRYLIVMNLYQKFVLWSSAFSSVKKIALSVRELQPESAHVPWCWIFYSRRWTIAIYFLRSPIVGWCVRFIQFVQDTDYRLSVSQNSNENDGYRK